MRCSGGCDHRRWSPNRSRRRSRRGRDAARGDRRLQPLRRPPVPVRRLERDRDRDAARQPDCRRVADEARIHDESVLRTSSTVHAVRWAGVPRASVWCASPARIARRAASHVGRRGVLRRPPGREVDDVLTAVAHRRGDVRDLRRRGVRNLEHPASEYHCRRLAGRRRLERRWDCRADRLAPGTSCRFN
jgi:hypothetical protein